MESFFDKVWVKNAICFTLLFLAWLVVLSGAANAATAPRTEVTVKSDNITVGDIFEDAGTHEAYVLAPAPAPGRTTVLDAASLNRIARAFGFSWRAQSPYDKTVIRRAATVISADQITQALKSALAEKGIEGRFDVELYNRALSFTMPGEISPALEVGSLEYDPARTEFQATVSVPAAAQAGGKPFHVSGRVHRLVDVPVLSRRLRNGDLIGKDDLQSVEMRLSDIDPSIVTDPAKLVGQTPRRGLSELRPVRIEEIQQPVAVAKGDMVTMMLSNKSLNLITQGRALESGAAGETVRIVNPSSNQVVEAVITGIKQVVVQPASSASIN